MKAVSSKPEWRIYDWSAEDFAAVESFSRDDADNRWLELLFSQPSTHLIRNVETRWGLARSADGAMPITINHDEYDNSYVCSPYNGCISYPLTEIRRLPGFGLRAALNTLVYAMAPWLRLGKINRVVVANNWLLSTNLYPKFDPHTVVELTRELSARFPQHAVAFRSLNAVSNKELMVQLETNGYILLPSRQVYFFDGRQGEFAKRPNTRWDRALLNKTEYRVVQHEELSDADALRIEELYRMLYVDKYSEHNPQFTVDFLNECRRQRILRMWGLKTREGKLDGIVGVFDRDGTMTAPLVGYDTAIPQRQGLYRLLMAIIMNDTLERNLMLNLSSGAADFKRLRGGTPHIEYTAVYCRHLNRKRKLIWRVLAFLLQNVGATVLRKYEL